MPLPRLRRLFNWRCSMTRTKIALYVLLIFLAGGIAGAGIRSAWQTSPSPARRGPIVREDFANHIFNRMKERLQLTPDQITLIEPVFRKGIEEVRAIQDRSVKEVEATVQRNHAELARLLSPEQRQKLEEWDREREKAWRERKLRRHTAGDKKKEPKEALSPAQTAEGAGPAK